MASSFEILNHLHSTYPRGLRALLGKTVKRASPIPPFIVPAALDRLAKSRFAPIVTIIPGEADAFCAALAWEKGAIILTNDSDLALYDLGPDGAVAFLHGLRKGSESSGTCDSLQARLWRHRDITKRLGVDVLRFAYEIRRTPNVRISQVLANAREQCEDIADLHAFFDEFDLNRFSTTKPTSLVSGLETVFLDPRLNELVARIMDPLADELRFYLPVQFSDPSRLTAWQPSRAIRRIAYALLIEAFGVGKEAVQKVHEHDPRLAFQSYLVEPAPDLSSSMQVLGSALSLHDNFYQYALTTSLSSPGRLATVSELFPRAIRSWQHVHLLGQVHGILYSLRMLKQSLGFLIQRRRVQADEAPNKGCQRAWESSWITVAEELFAKLENLPNLATLLPHSIGMEDYRKAVGKHHLRNHNLNDERKTEVEAERSLDQAAVANHSTNRDFILVPKSKRSKNRASGDVSSKPKAKDSNRQSGYYGVLSMEG